MAAGGGQAWHPPRTGGGGRPGRAATIAVLPAPVLPRSHTIGALDCARLRTSSGSAPDPGMSPNSTSLIAFQSRSRSPTISASSSGAPPPYPPPHAGEGREGAFEDWPLLTAGVKLGLIQPVERFHETDHLHGAQWQDGGLTGAEAHGIVGVARGVSYEDSWPAKIPV